MTQSRKKDRIIQILCQICFFIWLPESFALSLYAYKRVLRALCVGSAEGLAEPLLLLAALMVPALILGRYYCGYICSFGAMQDLSFAAAGKLTLESCGKKIIKASEKQLKLLSCLKFAVLALVSAGVFTEFSFWDDFSPWTAFGRLISLFKGDIGLKEIALPGALVLLGIVVISAFSFRFFCRYFCPLGAIFSIAGFFSLDRRTKSCKGSGDCCLCRYQCPKRKVDYRGIVLALVLFICVNAILLNHPLSSSSGLYPAEGRGSYEDGVYEGSGRGYRGDIKLSLTVEKGYITAAEILDTRDDQSYVKSAAGEILPAIISSQSAEVDAVSGATYSSKGLIEAAAKALEKADLNNTSVLQYDNSIASEEPDNTENSAADGSSDPKGSLEHLEDGIYEGVGIGFRGEITVSVEVTEGKIEKVRIISYYDNEEYLFHAAPSVIEAVKEGRELQADAVTGATYSSNGLIRAIANALNIDENCFTILEERPRREKNKNMHHQILKYVESDEEYLELTEKYRELMYGPDGRRIE